MTNWLLLVTQTCLILWDHTSHLFFYLKTHQLHEPLAPPNWIVHLYFVYLLMEPSPSSKAYQKRTEGTCSVGADGL